MAFKGFLSESVRYAEAPERHMPVCLSSRKEEREAKAEILHLAGEFLARFEQPGLQQEAAADAAPFQPDVPGMTQDEMVSCVVSDGDCCPPWVGDISS